MAQKPLILPIDTAGSIREVADFGGSLHSRWTQRSSTRTAQLISRGMLALSILLLIAVSALYGIRTLYSGKMYPAVSVAGVNVGGLTYDEATDRLQAQANSILASQVSLSYGDKVWTPTLADLGVRVDLPVVLDAAYGVGREEDARDRINSAVDLVMGEQSLPLNLTINATQLDQWFDSVDSSLGTPAQNAYLLIDQGKVSLVPEVNGTVVDRAQARNLLIESLRTSQPIAGQLPVTIEMASVHSTDLTPAMEQLTVSLSTPLKLTYGKSDWTITGVDLGQFVRQEIDPSQIGAAAVTLSVDEQKLGKFLSAMLRDEIDRDPKNAVVAWNYDKNKLVSVEKSVDGIELRPQKLTEAVVAAFWGDQKLIEIPVTVTKPTIDSKNLKALGITTRLGVGDSNFDGSDYGRAVNVEVGASLLNGTLVPPQGEFSFNYAIGEITEELGYVEAGVVDGERIGKDIGGGICQVSTTVFRAAFYAGLPIVEWNPHRYRLGFYEQDGWAPGLDASILQPEEDPLNGGDFKFQNPSDSWMLIESFVDGPRIYVVIFGADLGYDVQITGPYYPETKYPPTDDIELVDEELSPGTVQQTEYEMEGMDVSYQRTVYDRDGNLLWDRTFGTHFYPRGNVYKVSPDMKGHSPAAQDGN